MHPDALSIANTDSCCTPNFVTRLLSPWICIGFEVVVYPSATGIDFPTRVEGNLTFTCGSSGLLAMAVDFFSASEQQAVPALDRNPLLLPWLNNVINSSGKCCHPEKVSVQILLMCSRTFHTRVSYLVLPTPGHLPTARPSATCQRFHVR